MIYLFIIPIRTCDIYQEKSLNELIKKKFIICLNDGMTVWFDAKI